jgi:hypothetical protein
MSFDIDARLEDSSKKKSEVQRFCKIYKMSIYCDVVIN